MECVWNKMVKSNRYAKEFRYRGGGGDDDGGAGKQGPQACQI